MTGSAFQHLHENVDDPAGLREAYRSFLAELFSSSVWSGGPVAGKRVPWTLGEQASKQDGETFSSPGVYLWGAEKRPLYLGITRGKFKTRFSRYIWQKRSQCKLAHDHRTLLIEKGMGGFPEEIRQWYSTRYKGSTVRLQGSIRFAIEGIDGVWFTLLPHRERREIENLERALVGVAETWNREQGLSPLLNIEFNRGASDRKRARQAR